MAILRRAVVSTGHPNFGQPSADRLTPLRVDVKDCGVLQVTPTRVKGDKVLVTTPLSARRPLQMSQLAINTLDGANALESLLQYFERAPVALSRLEYLDDGRVLYRGNFHPSLRRDGPAGLGSRVPGPARGTRRLTFRVPDLFLRGLVDNDP